MLNVGISDHRKAAFVQINMQIGSITITSRFYRTMYGTAAPSCNPILRWHQRFLENRTLDNLLRSGRPAISHRIVPRIEAAFRSNPRLQVPRSSIFDALKRRLKIFPYKLSFLQELLPIYYAKRHQSALHCRTEWEFDTNFLSRIVFSDDCLFHISGAVDK